MLNSKLQWDISHEHLPPTIFIFLLNFFFLFPFYHALYGKFFVYIKSLNPHKTYWHYWNYFMDKSRSRLSQPWHYWHLGRDHSFLFIYLEKNFLCIYFFYFWDRERQNMNGGGSEREGDTESETGSRLWAVEPNMGLELTDCEIMTWVEIRRLTDWATWAPHIQEF